MSNGDVATRDDAISLGISSTPVIDIHNRRGGGTIAGVDDGTLLGVRRSRRRPGPACYGAGGTLPTVTDAHLALGRLRPKISQGPRSRFGCSPRGYRYPAQALV